MLHHVTVLHLLCCTKGLLLLMQSFPLCLPAKQPLETLPEHLNIVQLSML